MGPIQIFLLGFEDYHATGSVADELTALCAAGTIRVIDVRFLLRESAHELVAVRVSELEDSKREDLRAGAGALADLVGNADAAAGPIPRADAALDIAELGMSEAEVGEMAEELEVGDALLLLTIENVWAAGFASALRESGILFAQQDYLSSEGLVSLGAMLGFDVALETPTRPQFRTSA